MRHGLILLTVLLFNLVGQGVQWSASRHGNFIPGKNSTSHTLTGMLVGPRAGLDVLRRQENVLHLSGIESRIVQPIISLLLIYKPTVAQLVKPYITNPNPESHKYSSTVPSYLPKVRAIIILPSTPMSSKWSILFKFSDPNDKCLSFISLIH